MLKFKNFKGSNEGQGEILSSNQVIGTFSFKIIKKGVYIHYLELSPQHRGNRIVLNIIQEIKNHFNKNIFFHAQDLNDPLKDNDKLISYYKSIGFIQLKDNYFKF